MTYIICAYDRDRCLVVTIQASQLYTGPGKPNSFNVDLPLAEAYSRVAGIAESVFGRPHVSGNGRNKLIIRDVASISSFLVNVAGLARTLDMKLGS